MTTWQSIETAPRDGTEVIVRTDVAGLTIVRSARFNSEEEWNNWGKHCAAEGESKEDWVGWWSYENSVAQIKLDGWRTPTHWMPLP